MDTLNIGVILGSTRNKRFSEYPALWIQEQGAKHPGLSLNLIDLRDFSLPFLSDAVNPSKKNGVYTEESVTAFAEKIRAQDGYIIVTPEYNHSYPAVLKNAIDHIKPEWERKPMACVSYGTYGGVRAVEQLRLVMIDMHTVPLKYGVHITAPWDLRNEDGTLRENSLFPYETSAHSMLTELTWWAHALKTARSES